jgi:hypothetical protein
MSWSLRWSVVAERDLLSIPWRVAAEVDAAVKRFAATGQGDVRRVEPTNYRRLKLRVRGAEAWLSVDPAERTISVSRVFPRGT